ncbi:MaoC/PaaZ C-terminal domain-containing protein [Kineococcus terrestris]|uniref:MaoC/PaaZ C-terminal domain-containing protein n=1 Tax=Kineococcus terrestris TaxID=2044856 RepID=UPI0034DB5825
MSTTTRTTVAPALARSYARSLLRRGSERAVDLPRTRYVQHGVRADVDRLAAFCRETGSPLRDRLPLPYGHLLGFGLQVDLLVSEPFPFRLLGLVHVHQRFVQRRALRLEDGLADAAGFDVAVRATGMRPHRRGALVDVVTEVRAPGDDLLGPASWEGRSRYLARGVRVPGAPAREDDPLPRPERGAVARWRVDAGTGRRWAALSGDVNPIHLAAPAARLFGFRRAIAHGMWTASRSLAALDPLPERVRADVEFAAPLLLPADVEHVVARDADGWSTVVRGRPRGERPARVHLVSRVEELPAP